MPFSKERTEFIQRRIQEALGTGAYNQWERSFLGDVARRFDRYGTATTLSDAQYRTLAKLLKLQPEARRRIQSAADSKPKVSSGFERRSARAMRPPRLMPRFNPFWRLQRSLRLVSVPVVALLVIGAMFGGGTPQVGGTSVATYASRALSVGEIRVIDGDTVAIRGERADVRLVGFNAPEVSSPACSAELALGQQATTRLLALLKQASEIEFVRVACSCPPGTEGTSRCNYGRECGTLKVDDKDVGTILISEGLAAPYRCGPTSCPPRPGNWCG